MSPKRIIYSIGLALTLASCADDIVTDRSYDDGSISFVVDPQGQSFSTRGGNAAPALSYLGSLPIEGETPLWLHIESSENPVITEQLSTRAMPKTISDVETFNVTAVLNDDDSQKFIDNAAVKQNGSTWSFTNATYYWPQNDALTFYCTPNNLPVSVTPANGNFTFDYTVPHSDDGVNDANAQPDFVLATHKYTRSQANGGKAEIKFRHPLAGLCFLQDENLTETGIHITKIELSGLKGEGSCTFNGINDVSSTSISKWETKGSAQTYVQTVGENSEGVKVPVATGKEITAVAQPFMLIPQADLNDFKCKVTVSKSGVSETKEVSLASIGGGSLEPGHIYIITLSNLDGKYPPVENLKGMAGNGTVSLTWENPEQTFPHIHQCGVTVRIIQKDASGKETSRLEVVKHWEDSHDKKYPDSYFDKNGKPLLDLFAYVKRGYKLDSDNNRVKDDDGNYVEIDIDTRNNEEFECHVIADYYNENDGDTEIHQSIARTITIKPEKTNDKFLFYVPSGGILDDDDKAAWEWFRKTYPEGKQVTKDDLSSYAKIEELLRADYDVMWFPCGVKLRDGGNVSVYSRDDLNIEDLISKAEEILKGDRLKEITIDKEDRLDLYNKYQDELAPKLQSLGSVAGMYDDPTDGTIRHTDPAEYFTDADIKAIRDFYNAGGNLLLTTFAIELVYEFEVITAVNRHYGPGEDYPYRPNFRFFNEIKPSSIWFLRPNFGDHQDNIGHKIYSGMFICKADIFPETAKDVFSGGFPVFVASDTERTELMFPLLSMGAEACENNNVIWDFGREGGKKSMKNMEDDNNARFLGTWGQIANTSVGVAVEFYPGATETIWPWDHPESYIRDCWYPAGATDTEKDRIKEAVQKHGRCIAIGLGAYEFNNGLKYDAAGEVLNMYQSNVQKLTSNSLKYLKEAKPDERAPGEKVTR